MELRRAEAVGNDCAPCYRVARVLVVSSRPRRVVDDAVGPMGKTRPEADQAIRRWRFAVQCTQRLADAPE